jgi:hypothetical protein
MMVILSKRITKKKYLKYLDDLFNEDQILGIQLCKKEDEINFHLAYKFQSLYLSPGLKETTISKFLFENPSVLEKAFSAKFIHAELTCKWMVNLSANAMEDAIRPDFLIQRNDCYYDFVELKTAALQKNKITKGKRCRRRL